MDYIIKSLEQINKNTHTKICGTNVQKINENIFFLKGLFLNKKQTITLLKIIECSIDNLPYDRLIFCLVKPPSYIISKHTIDNLNEYKSLVNKAKNDNLLLYYAIIDKANKQPHVISTWLIVDDTVNTIQVKPEHINNEDSEDVNFNEVPNKSQVQKTKQLGMHCPFCNKKMNSTPGRTLHVKNKHPDKLDEYRSML